MPPITSQTDNLTELFRRKNLTVVPKDQEKLLQRSDAWAADLKKAQRGLVNVPSDVLEGVKMAYLTSRHGPTQSGREAASQLVEESAVPKSPNTSRLDNEPSSSPERSIPWDDSPERPSSVRRQQALAPSIVHETPSAPNNGQPSFVKHRERLERATVYEPPSSDDEEELETHVPQGERNTSFTTRTQDVDDSSEDEEYESEDEKTIKTPPCAQPDEQIIPGTVTVESTETGTVPHQRRQRRMKPISFSDNSPYKQKMPQIAAVAPRMQPLKRFDIETQDSSIPSSFIPATARDSTQVSVSERGPPPVQDAEQVSQTQRSSGPLHDGQQAEEVQERTREDEDKMQEDERDQETQDEEDEVEEEEAQVEEPEPMVQDGPQATPSADPYAQFQTAYPDYQTTRTGTLTKFIKACVCLEYLQRERALRECLYDEFIGCFSDGYLSYVAKAGPGQEPLPAIEWFNIQRGPIRYSKMAITRESLQSVLQVHHAEVSQVRSLILGGSEADESETYVGDKQTLKKGQATAVVGSEPMDVDDPEPASEPESEPEPEPSPTPAVVQPVPVPTPHTPQSDTLRSPASQIPLRMDIPPPPIATPTPQPSLPRSVKKERPSSVHTMPRPSPHLRSGESRASTAQAVPLASQYMAQLASRRAASNPNAEAERRAKLMEFIRKRNSIGGRNSSSSRAGSAGR